MKPLVSNLLAGPSLDPGIASTTDEHRSHRHFKNGAFSMSTPNIPPSSAARQVTTTSASPGDNALSRESASYDRRRAGRACLVCRARKTKCDNQRPVCGFCLATGGQCRYPDDETSDLSKLDRGTLAILQRLGEMENKLAALVTERDPQPNRDVLRWGDAGSPGRLEGSSTATTGSSFVRAGLRVTPEDNHPPTARIILEGSEMTLESILRWPVFDLGDIPSVVSLLAQQHLVTNQTSRESIFDLDPETVVHLVESFLSNNHIKNPIFDVGTLWSQVQDFLDHGLSWNGTSCLVLLICAVGVLAPPIDKERQPGFSRQANRIARAEMFFQASQRRLGMAYHESSLVAIQCSFLTAVYLMSTFRILAAWKAFSQAGTQCVGWLAAREGDAGMQTPVEESLYWSCLKSELELRSELGLPGSSLNEMGYPHAYPSPPGLDVMPERPSAVGGIPSDEAREQLERGWFFYLAEIALRRIMNDPLSSRYHEGSWYFTTQWWTEGDDVHFCQHVDEFKQKIDAWYETLPPAMAFSRNPEDCLGDPLRGILRGHVIDILDVLLYPAVQALVGSPPEELSPSILKIAWEALRTAMGRIAICREGFYHRHQGTWLMIRTCSRSALQLLGVAMSLKRNGLACRGEDSLPAIVPDGWREAAATVIELLEYWEDESPDLAVLLARLRQLLVSVQT